MSNIITIKKENIVIRDKVSHMFDSIREVWRGRGLVERSITLLKVDPSSACQRMFNAAISDLRDKLILVGIDVLKSVTEFYKLEKIVTEDDIKDYKIRGLIDLAHFSGLLTNPEKNRMHRAYDIRNDLEHEDAEYIANESDVIYVFQTCIEAILSKDPVHLIKVSDVQKFIESTEKVYPDLIMVDDYKTALTPRQEAIMKQLIGISLDESKPDIVRENAYNTLKAFSIYTQNDVKLSITTHFSDKLRTLSYRSAKIFFAAGIFPYTDIKSRQRFFDEIYDKLTKVGYSWDKYPDHRDALNVFYEIGYLNYCPKDSIFPIIKWLVMLYLGTKSNSYYRSVNYSNVGAPMSLEILTKSFKTILPYKDQILKDTEIIKLIKSYDKIESRLLNLIDAIEDESKK